MGEKTKAVFLTGDLALIKEWSELFHKTGIKTFVNVTSDRESGRLPANCEPTADVPLNCQSAFELTILDDKIKEKNLRQMDEHLPPAIPIFTASATRSTAEQASWVQNSDRLLGISAFPTLTSRPLIEIAPSVRTSKEIIAAAENIFFLLNKKIAVIQDRVGMVLPRILCSVINEAFFAAMDGVASVEDIDTAMKKGSGYPLGPLEWANSIGLPYIVAVLEAVHRDTGDDRYRIAPMLRQMSFGAKWWNG
jgi:3-hydroxybutyryl-CoA dehydrogenase